MYKKMNYVRLLGLTCLLSLFMSFASYAELDKQKAENIQRTNEFIDKYSELHLEVMDDKLYNVDKNGNIEYGYSYDNYGNIYYTPFIVGVFKDMDKGILIDTKNEKGVYFDKQGHMVNPSESKVLVTDVGLLDIEEEKTDEIHEEVTGIITEENVSITGQENIIVEELNVTEVTEDSKDTEALEIVPYTYKNLAFKFERNGNLDFSTIEEIEDFLEYYILQYSLTDLKADRYKLEKVSLLDEEKNVVDVGYTLTILEDLEDREVIEQKIIEKFGHLEGDTLQEKLYSVCDKINEFMDYDIGYEPLTLSKALADSKGVCWQYAKIANVLLQDAGVQSEVMLGYLNGETKEGHAWIRVEDRILSDSLDTVKGTGEVVGLSSFNMLNKDMSFGFQREEVKINSTELIVDTVSGSDGVKQDFISKYYYCDPTTVESTGDFKYSNISYREYCKRYAVSRYVEIY